MFLLPWPRLPQPELLDRRIRVGAEDVECPDSERVSTRLQMPKATRRGAACEAGLALLCRFAGALPRRLASQHAFVAGDRPGRRERERRKALAGHDLGLTRFRSQCHLIGDPTLAGCAARFQPARRPQNPREKQVGVGDQGGRDHQEDRRDEDKRDDQLDLRGGAGGFSSTARRWSRRSAMAWRPSWSASGEPRLREGSIEAIRVATSSPGIRPRRRIAPPGAARRSRAR